MSTVYICIHMYIFWMCRQNQYKFLKNDYKEGLPVSAVQMQARSYTLNYLRRKLRMNIYKMKCTEIKYILTEYQKIFKIEDKLK